MPLIPHVLLLLLRDGRAALAGSLAANAPAMPLIGVLLRALGSVGGTGAATGLLSGGAATVPQRGAPVLWPIGVLLLLLGRRLRLRAPVPGAAGGPAV